MAYSPCVILIDEWVAYARELFRADLPAGSFDTQFTFAQLLTESVASVPGALLVVSIPASDIEVGGTHGQEALTRLQNIVRRIADQWRPASSQESFEIVRRRLFEDTSGAARTDIAAVARRFTQFYAENQRQFPSQVRRGRVRAADPRLLPAAPRTVRPALRRLVDAGAVPAHPGRTAADVHRHLRAVAGQRRLPADHAGHHPARRTTGLR